MGMCLKTVGLYQLAVKKDFQFWEGQTFQVLPIPVSSPSEEMESLMLTTFFGLRFSHRCTSFMVRLRN